MKLASPSKPGSPFTSFRSILGAAIGLTLVIASIGTASAASWKITKGNNDDLPGQNVTVTQDG